MNNSDHVELDIAILGKLNRWQIVAATEAICSQAIAAIEKSGIALASLPEIILYRLIRLASVSHTLVRPFLRKLLDSIDCPTKRVLSDEHSCLDHLSRAVWLAGQAAAKAEKADRAKSARHIIHDHSARTLESYAIKCFEAAARAASSANQTDLLPAINKQIVAASKGDMHSLDSLIVRHRTKLLRKRLASLTQAKVGIVLHGDWRDCELPDVEYVGILNASTRSDAPTFFANVVQCRQILKKMTVNSKNGIPLTILAESSSDLKNNLGKMRQVIQQLGLGVLGYSQDEWK